MKICLNADMGESYGRFRIGDDDALMPLVSSANIACGMHAGDPSVMVRSIELARLHGTSIGAHPGFNDIWGFGRRRIAMDPRDIEYLVTYQIGALMALAEDRSAYVGHVKPHGALNNMAHSDGDIARAVARGIRAAGRDLIFVANCRSEMTRAGEEEGLCVAHEAYVDREYDDSGKMLSRTEANAVIRDPEQAATQVLGMITEQALITSNGKRIPTRIDTFCIHGDEPTAVALAKRTNETLSANGIRVVPISEMVGEAVVG
jgi:UPF0271 protein